MRPKAWTFVCQAEEVGLVLKAPGAPGGFRQVRQDKMVLLESCMGRWAGERDRTGALGWGVEPEASQAVFAHFLGVMQRGEEQGLGGGVVEVMSLGSGKPWCVQARVGGGGLRSLGWQGGQVRDGQVVGLQARVDTEVLGLAMWGHAMMGPHGAQPKKQKRDNRVRSSKSEIYSLKAHLLF